MPLLPLSTIRLMSSVLSPPPDSTSSHVLHQQGKSRQLQNLSGSGHIAPNDAMVVFGLRALRDVAIKRRGPARYRLEALYGLLRLATLSGEREGDGQSQKETSQEKSLKISINQLLGQPELKPHIEAFALALLRALVHTTGATVTDGSVSTTPRAHGAGATVGGSPMHVEHPPYSGVSTEEPGGNDGLGGEEEAAMIPSEDLPYQPRPQSLANELLGLISGSSSSLSCVASTAAAEGDSLTDGTGFLPFLDVEQVRCVLGLPVALAAGRDPAVLTELFHVFGLIEPYTTVSARKSERKKGGKNDEEGGEAEPASQAAEEHEEGVEGDDSKNVCQANAKLIVRVIRENLDTIVDFITKRRNYNPAQVQPKPPPLVPSLSTTFFVGGNHKGSIHGCRCRCCYD